MLINNNIQKNWSFISTWVEAQRKWRKLTQKRLSMIMFHRSLKTMSFTWWKVHKKDIQSMLLLYKALLEKLWLTLMIFTINQNILNLLQSYLLEKNLQIDLNIHYTYIYNHCYFCHSYIENQQPLTLSPYLQKTLC